MIQSSEESPQAVINGRNTIVPPSIFDEVEHSKEQTSKKLDFDHVINEIGAGFWQFQLLSILCVGTLADAMELTLLGFLTPCAAIEFGLNDSETSLISAIVFLGAFFGSLCFGYIADHYGRKLAYSFSLLLIFIFGVGTYFSQNYIELEICLGGVGFGIGGCVAPFDYLSETVPSKTRGFSCMVSLLTYGVGSLSTTTLAWAVLEPYGWRVLSLCCTIPILLALLATFSIPESPRWLLTMGRQKEAVKALNIAAKKNNVDLGFFTLKPPVKKSEERGIIGSCTKSLRWKTLLFSLTWTSFGFAYFAIVSEIPEVFMTSTSDKRCSFEYPRIVVSSVAEPFFAFLSLYFIDKSRRLTQAICYSLAGSSMILLGTKLNPNVLVVFAFAARGCINVSSNATWVATPESYPTEIRAITHSLFYNFSRAGAFLSSYLVYSELPNEIICFIIAGFCFLPSLCACLMDETAGLDLDETPNKCQQYIPVAISHNEEGCDNNDRSENPQKMEMDLLKEREGCQLNGG